MNDLINKAKKIRCVICDVDGVLTDGLSFIDNNGNEYKGFNIQDGLGLKLLQAANIEVAVITGSKHAIIDHRMQQLAIKHYYKGIINKKIIYDKLKKDLNLNDEEFAYIGDDLPDLNVMRQVGLSIAVANAVSTIKENAHFNTELPGGHGGVRQACDFILTAQNIMNVALERFIANA